MSNFDSHARKVRYDAKSECGSGADGGVIWHQQGSDDDDIGLCMTCALIIFQGISSFQ